MAVVDTKKEVIKYFDDFKDYGIYYQGPWKFYRQQYVKKIKDKFKESSGIKILDLGCGRMCSLPDLLNEEFVNEYHCVDASLESLEVLKEKVKGSDKIKIQASDLNEYLNVVEEKFDVIIFFGVLMYLSRDQVKEAISQAGKILTKNGIVVIHEPNERARNKLDEHSSVLDEKMFQDLKSYNVSMNIMGAYYNICLLRMPGQLFYKILRKVKKMIGIRVAIIDKTFLVIEEFMWEMESVIEELLSQIRMGCDSMIIMEKTDDLVGKKLLDLGCGIRKRNGSLGVDIMPNETVDVVHDLNSYPYPFSDKEFDDILLDNSLEHLDDTVKTMEELCRISKAGARITIKVPYFRSHYAIDPTHKQYFCSHSLYYFDPLHEFHKLYKYSDKAFVNVDRVVFDEEYAYGLIDTLRLGIVRWFANKYPMRYENYLSHLFPLNCLTFYLTVKKD